MFSKKMWLGVVFAAAALFVQVQAADTDFDDPVTSDVEAASKSVGHQLLWYIPNRLVDLADCFTVELSAGEIALDAYLTRYATVGGGIGYSALLGWSGDYRAYGAYTQRGWNGDFFPLNACEIQRDNLFGSYNSARAVNCGLANCENMKNLQEDPYAIGGKAAFWFGVKLQFHPVQFADFLTGLFFIDICDDDN